MFTRPLVALALALVLVQTVSAVRADRAPQQLIAGASDIVVGQVTDISAASARDVSFAGHDGFTLHGSLLGEGTASAAVPAVLLLPGSGPTDRDGNQKPAFVTNVLSQIAHRLQRDGVATLRFDKRACAGYASQWPKDPAALSTFFAYQPFIEDVKAAYRFMRAQPGIDPRRCAILGHSEGGLFALQSASDLAATADQPASIACVATAGRTLDHLLREQIAALLRTQKADQPTFDAMMAALERGIVAAKSKAPVPADMPMGLRALFNPSTTELLNAYFTVDPLALARRVRGPVLVLNGDNDLQVSAERDAQALAAALRSRPGEKPDDPAAPVTLVIVEGASHNLKDTTGPTDAGVAGPVAAKAMDAIASWAKGL